MKYLIEFKDVLNEFDDLVESGILDEGMIADAGDWVNRTASRMTNNYGVGNSRPQLGVMDGISSLTSNAGKAMQYYGDRMAIRIGRMKRNMEQKALARTITDAQRDFCWNAKPPYSHTKFCRDAINTDTRPHRTPVQTVAPQQLPINK